LNPQGPEPSNGIFPCHLRDDQISVGSVGSGSRTGASGFSGESGGSLMGGGEGSAGERRLVSFRSHGMTLRCRIRLGGIARSTSVNSSAPK